MSKARRPSSVNVSALKSQLAKYLRLVQSGCEVVVTDHRVPVARIIPYEAAGSLETLKPRGQFAEVAHIETVPPRSGETPIDSLEALLIERGNG